MKKHGSQKHFPLRRRTSRPQSGYAFSHERGFGTLITSGRMSMREGRGQRRPAKTVSDKVEAANSSRKATGRHETDGVTEIYRPIPDVWRCRTGVVAFLNSYYVCLYYTCFLFFGACKLFSPFSVFSPSPSRFLTSLKIAIRVFMVMFTEHFKSPIILWCG